MEERTVTDREDRIRKVSGFQVVEEECVWRKLGVIDFRGCHSGRDCHNCSFDKGMREEMGLATFDNDSLEHPGWVEYLRRNRHGASRPCLHALTDRTSAPKICTMDYECTHCPYDQMLDDFSGPFGDRDLRLEVEVRVW